MRQQRAPDSHIYVCPAEHIPERDNPLTHTLGHQPYTHPIASFYHYPGGCQYSGRWVPIRSSVDFSTYTVGQTRPKD